MRVIVDMSWPPCVRHELSAWQILLNSPSNPVSTHFTIRKPGHATNNWMITNLIRFRTEAFHRAASQQQKKGVQVKSLRDSNIYSSGRRRAGSKKKTQITKRERSRGKDRYPKKDWQLS